MVELLDLPDELLLLLMGNENLELEDKMRFTSCCTHLRHLGDTRVSWQVGRSLPARMPSWQLASFRRWLLRKRHVLHRLLLVVKGDSADGDRNPNIQGARSLLASLNGGGLRALTIGLHSYETAPDAGFAVGGWLAAAHLPQLRFLDIDSGSPMDNTVGADCLTRLTHLQSLCLNCNWLDYGGLGQPGQPPFLPASLTSLELFAAWYLPRLETATRLQRLVVKNSAYADAYAFNTSGLEAATGLTALELEGCLGLVFSSGSGSGSDNDSMDSSDEDSSSDEEGEDVPFSSLVPLAALSRLRGLSLLGSIPADAGLLPLATSTLEVLSVPRNPALSALPIAPSAIAHSLRRLCVDIGVVAGSGAQLRQLLALEEMDVLLPDQHPPLEEREEVRLQQPAALAALRGPPRLRLVGVEKELAALLGGFEGSRWAELLARPAISATLAAWAQQLPGKRVVEMTSALGPMRPLPNFGKPEWDTMSID